MEANKQPGFGRYGDLRKEYLQNHRPAQYEALIRSCKLELHLMDREAKSQDWITEALLRDIQRCPCPQEPAAIAPWITEMAMALKGLEQMAVILFVNGD